SYPSFCYCFDGDHRRIQPFPTRRSSDLYDTKIDDCRSSALSPAGAILALRRPARAAERGGAGGARSRSPRSAVRQPRAAAEQRRSEEHTSELQSLRQLVCRLLLEKKKKQ